MDTRRRAAITSAAERLRISSIMPSDAPDSAGAQRRVSTLLVLRPGNSPLTTAPGG